MVRFPDAEVVPPLRCCVRRAPAPGIRPDAEQNAASRRSLLRGLSSAPAESRAFCRKSASLDRCASSTGWRHDWSEPGSGGRGRQSGAAGRVGAGCIHAWPQPCACYRPGCALKKCIGASSSGSSLSWPQLRHFSPCPASRLASRIRGSFSTWVLGEVRIRQARYTDGRITPFVSAGVSNTISDTHFFYRPFTQSFRLARNCDPWSHRLPLSRADIKKDLTISVQILVTLFVVLIPGNRTHAEIGRTASVDVDKSKQRRSGRELTSFDQLLFVRTVQKGSARLPTALEFRPCLVARIGFVGVDVLDIIRRLV